MYLKRSMRVVQLTTSPPRNCWKHTNLFEKDERFTLVNECYGVIDIVWFSDTTPSTTAGTTTTANLLVCRKRSMMFPNHPKRTKILSGKIWVHNIPQMKLEMVLFLQMNMILEKMGQRNLSNNEKRHR